MAAFFWQLPLPLAWEDSDVDGRAAGACRGGAFAPAPRREEVSDFWRLPLLALLPEDSDDDSPSQPRPPPPAPATEPPPPAAGAGGAGGGGAENGEEAAEEQPPAKPQKPLRSRNLAEEMTEMLDRYAAERGALQRNLAELVEMQERLRLLTVKAAADDEAVLLNKARIKPEVSGDISPTGPPPTRLGRLPSEVLDRILWLLDFSSLGRVTSAGRHWKRLALSKPRWRQLCEKDWGVTGGSWQDYRLRLGRWRLLRSVITGLKGSGCPSGICGSLLRRRLFEALESLAELGTAPNPGAWYPSQVPVLLDAVDGGSTLVALLEDESPHLLCLAVRCLADLASLSAQRPALRESIIRRGALVRALLEGDDIDVVEASARLILNLHEASGVPLTVRRRGPDGFSSCGAGRIPAAEASCVGEGAASAEAWSGLWVGEMRYARGGERHAELKLVLGAAGDKSVEHATAAFLAAHKNVRDFEADEDGGHPPTRMQGEGGHAEFWRYFGFLAASDFDNAGETVRYLDEVIERRRQPSSPTSQSGSPLNRSTSATCGPMLQGAGWDGQNGTFLAEAVLPVTPPLPTPSSRNSSGAAITANAVPLRLQLTYRTRGSTYQLTGFLAEGAAPAAAPGSDGGRGVCCGGAGAEAEGGADGASGAAGRVPVLYGVWATMPSNHKHLFVLRKVAPLPDLERPPPPTPPPTHA